MPRMSRCHSSRMRVGQHEQTGIDADALTPDESVGPALPLFVQGVAG